MDYPGAPGVSASPGSAAGQITVSWGTPSNGGSPITHYNIYRADVSGGTYTLLATDTASPYEDSGLGNGVTKYYQVRAVNAVGPGAAGSASATTYVEPTAPQALVAASGPTDTTLSWQPPSYTGGAILQYRIYRGYASGGQAPEPLAQVDGTVQSYTDTTCRVGQACFYTVSAVNVVGEGPSSNEASALGTAFPPDDPGFLHLLLDWDQDGHSNTDEVQGNSNPTNKGSDPTTNDDGDCKANGEEHNALTARGLDSPAVVFDPQWEIDLDRKYVDIYPNIGIHVEDGTC